MHTEIAPLSPWKELPSEPAILSGPIGISTLPSQRLSKISKKGFCLNVMLIGEAGLGKTTFFNTLFENELVQKVERSFEERKKVKFTVNSFDLEEGGVKVTINVFESIEFGVHVKKEDGIGPILSYLEEKLDSYLDASEQSTRDHAAQDIRIHACLYFLRPSGHELSELDLAMISKIHDKVNLIPVIAKADSFTPDECRKYKQLILDTIIKRDIKVYPLAFEPDLELEGYPYSIIGSEGEYEVDGQKVRGRKFKWGIAQVDNPEHCDFGKLKDILIRERFLDLIDKTNVIFEEYRRKKLLAKGVTDVIMESDDDFQEKLDQQRQAFLQQAAKDEKEISERFKRLEIEEEARHTAQQEELVKKRQAQQEEIAEMNKKYQQELENFENMQAEAEGDNDDPNAKEEKKKKRSSLSGMTKSLRRK